MLIQPVFQVSLRRNARIGVSIALSPAVSWPRIRAARICLTWIRLAWISLARIRRPRPRRRISTLRLLPNTRRLPVRTSGRHPVLRRRGLAIPPLRRLSINPLPILSLGRLPHLLPVSLRGCLPRSELRRLQWRSLPLLPTCPRNWRTHSEHRRSQSHAPHRSRFVHPVHKSLHPRLTVILSEVESLP